MTLTIHEVKECLKNLNTNQPFSNFNLGLSQEEVNNLNAIRIDSTNAYDNFGNLNLLNDQLDEFLKIVNGENAQLASAISSSITTLVRTIIDAFAKETAWITVRASTPTHSWDIPRWHTDGYYYSPYIGDQHKVVITLKGPSSLFCPLPFELRPQFNFLQFDSKNREIVADMLKIIKAQSSISQQQGTVYIVGNSSHAAVHSEPPIHEERLFLSIVPGNKSEIQELYNNWHPKT